VPLGGWRVEGRSKGRGKGEQGGKGRNTQLFNDLEGGNTEKKKNRNTRTAGVRFAWKEGKHRSFDKRGGGGGGDGKGNRSLLRSTEKGMVFQIKQDFWGDDLKTLRRPNKREGRKKFVGPTKALEGKSSPAVSSNKKGRAEKRQVLPVGQRGGESEVREIKNRNRKLTKKRNFSNVAPGGSDKKEV